VLVGRTTTSCSAVALVALLLTSADPRAEGSDKVVSPKFPIALVWSVDLDDAGVGVPPVSDDTRAYIAFRSGHLAAHDLKDGHEVWRIDKQIASPMAVAGGLLFVSAGDAIEALRGADHAAVWTIPRVTTTAPLIALADWVIAVTDTEVLRVAAKDGHVVWRTPAGGVKLPPAVDENRVYLGANDGRVLALSLDTGEVLWEAFVPDGVTAIGARHEVVYVGGGDKNFHSLKNAKDARPVRRVGAIVTERLAFDDEHVYFAAKNNVVSALDLGNGNQRWSEPIRSRPFDGVIEAGHIVFVPLASHELPMLFAGNGKASGTLALPGDVVQGVPPDVQETATGVRIVVVTGGLNNRWQLSLFATSGEPSLVPVGDFLPGAGADLLTDPALQPIGRVLGTLVLGDPPLVPVEMMGFPVVLQDPPLEPLTTLPGLQLRPLSPQLPSRRGGS
jgi:outer membrane protein assembly factor BamB